MEHIFFFFQVTKYRMRYGEIWKKNCESNGNNIKEDALKSQSICQMNTPRNEMMIRSLASSRFVNRTIGGSKYIGRGAVGLRAFFQSVRPTRQGFSLESYFRIDPKYITYLVLILFMRFLVLRYSSRCVIIF